MFWKKPSKPVELKISDDDRRDAFRIEPVDAGSVMLVFPDCEIGVLDLSAGDCLFRLLRCKKG